MDGWILFNFTCAAIALIANSIRFFKRDNPRRWLRLPAALIALYIAGVYLASMLGIVPESEIRFFMRWFQGAITIYLTVEALNG